MICLVFGLIMLVKPLGSFKYKILNKVIMEKPILFIVFILFFIVGCTKTCPEDLKVCPNGQTLERMPGLNCEFASCPPVCEVNEDCEEYCSKNDCLEPVCECYNKEGCEGENPIYNKTCDCIGFGFGSC